VASPRMPDLAEPYSKKVIASIMYKPMEFRHARKTFLAGKKKRIKKIEIKNKYKKHIQNFIQRLENQQGEDVMYITSSFKGKKKGKKKTVNDHRKSMRWQQQYHGDHKLEETIL